MGEEARAQVTTPVSASETGRGMYRGGDACGMTSGGLPTWCKDTLARRHPRLARMAAGPGIIEPPTLERAVAAVAICVPCELTRISERVTTQTETRQNACTP